MNFLDPYGLDCLGEQYNVNETVCEAEGIEVTGRKGGDGREKGTTDNFGNPCARGGHCGGGTTGGDPRPAGPGGDPKPKISKQCLLAAGFAAATIAGDALVLSGAGAVVKAGFIAYAAGANARSFATSAIAREFVVGEIATSNAAVANGFSAASFVAGRNGPQFITNRTAANLAKGAQGFGTTALSYIPVVASGMAIYQAGKTCLQ